MGNEKQTQPPHVQAEGPLCALAAAGDIPWGGLGVEPFRLVLGAGLLLEAERQGVAFGFSLGGKGFTSKGPSPASPQAPPPGNTYLLATQAAERAFLEGALRGVKRALGLKGVLLAHGLRLQVVRGYEPLRFGGE